MKYFWLLVLAIIPFNSLASQEVQHAPTVEQCRADQRLWLTEAQETYVPAPFMELHNRNKEMIQCETVDPYESNHYYNTLGETNAEKVIRLHDFIDRHNLGSQFVAEDAQGKR